MTICSPQVLGADPLSIKWNVVRGDTSILRIEFLEKDEITPLNISQWTFDATAYNPQTDIVYPLEVELNVEEGSATIVAEADITAEWGVGVGGRIAELVFDLQIAQEDDVIWTPVIGNISVLGDVTGGNL
jgi:hypothetical protein